MRVLLLQFLDPRDKQGLPVFNQSLGVLSALLKQEGMEVHLEALAGHQPRKLHRAIIHRRPQWILADLNTRTYHWARRNLVTIAEKYQLPVLAAGQYATCRSARAISIPGVAALIRGPYPRAACRFLQSQDSQEPDPDIPGLWSRMDGHLLRAPLTREPPDWENLPFADRLIFQTAEQVQQSGELPFSAVLGCPQWCAYCINDWYLDLYPQSRQFVKRRDVEDLIEEIIETVATYPAARRVVFLNHAFAMDQAWLEEFAGQYPRACGLDMTCHVRLNALTPSIVSLLARANCTRVHTQIGCGSDFVRNEILTMQTSREQIAESVEMLNQAEIEISADVFIGAPYETEITIEETLDLLARLDIRDLRPKVFYPLAGTRSAELCTENGWISGHDLTGYWEQRSILDMPTLPGKLIDSIYRKLPDLLVSDRRRLLRKLLNRSRRKQ